MIKRNKRVTLKDIAAEAGVSMMTVSNVLNGRGSVSAKTSRRITEIARRMNYRPNQVARSLRVEETRTLGVVVSDSSQLVLSKVIRAIESEAAQAGYSVIVANTDQSPQREKAAIELLLNKRIDGLLLAAPLNTDDSQMRTLVHFGIPLVFLMRTSRTVPVNSVANDNEQGGYEIVRHLIQTGRNPICFLSLPRESQSGQSRIAGYRRAFQEAGLNWRDDALHYCQPEIASGYDAMSRLLEDGACAGAVCCGCDLIAVGAIRAIQERGLAVPDDLAVTGYDDIDMAEYLCVPLTTMRQPKDEMGREGVRLLLEQIRDPEHEPRQVILPSTLVVRGSA